MSAPLFEPFRTIPSIISVYEFPPIRLLVETVYRLVDSLTEFLAPLAGSGSAALAVILLTVAVRAALIPVGRSQVRAAATRARLAPRLAELQRRHRTDPEALQRKTMELYRSEGASPVAGCLPLLAQMPVLTAVYGVFLVPTIAGETNTLLTHTLLGIPLGRSLLAQISSAPEPVSIAVFAAIIVIIGVVAQLSRRLLGTAPPTAGAPSGGTTNGGPAPDRSAWTRVLGLLPFATAVVAAFVPLAAALYLTVTTAWTLGERLILTRVFRAPTGSAR